MLKHECSKVFAISKGLPTLEVMMMINALHNTVADSIQKKHPKATILRSELIREERLEGWEIYLKTAIETNED